MPYQAAGRKIKSTIKGGKHDGEEGFSGMLFSKRRDETGRRGNRPNESEIKKGLAEVL